MQSDSSHAFRSPCVRPGRVHGKPSEIAVGTREIHTFPALDHDRGLTMHITEADRIEMLAELRRCHGQRVGDIIAEDLPPVSWQDVARSSDIIALRRDFETLRRDLEAVREEIRSVEKRLEKKIDTLASAMWAMGGIMTTGFIGLFALIATKL